VPDLARQISRILLYGIGLGSATAFIYLVGPWISFGDFRPLESFMGRSIAVLLIYTAVGSFTGFKWFSWKKRAKALTDGVAADDKHDSDEVVLKDKLKDALATLKTASGGKKDYLYDLPWYLLIGPPGSGKTTALVNSGLKFPLSRGATPAAIAGVGGTRYCDWWFTEDAVLIDTAGRYTTQDSDAKADKTSWLAFLDLIKKTRPRQPINGVMVAISLEDLMLLNPAELAAHSNAIRMRLLELHERLKVDFPVYAIFTKGDLVAGFSEYFGYLGDNGRKQVWGATFQTNDKTRNLVGEVPVEFDQLLERLSEEQLDRLQDEPAPNTRVLLFGFAAQMARLKKPLFDFLNQIFEPTRYHANATLRGFYFTSGTQQGSPIDQLIGSLVRSFGAEEVAPAAYSGLGKSFFLHDLILKVVIGEAAWVSTDWRAVRRAMIMKATAFAAIALVCIGLSLVWFVSYNRNRALIDQTEVAAEAYAKAAGIYATETVIADRDLHKILPLLDNLRALPAGYGGRDLSTPLAATFGLSQRERLQSASENIYRIGLERMFRSRLIFRLEEQLAANLNNPGFIYEALKVYMMLGGLQPPDKALITNWMQQDWVILYPGPSNLQPISRLGEHLAALFALESGEPLIELDGALIENCQRTLARLSVAQRAYELLKSQSRATAADWIVARKGGPDIALVFDAPGGLESVRVPGFFTYDGFQRGFIEPLGDIAERIKKERWVLGPAGEGPALSTQYDNLPEQMLQLYEREFKLAWDNALSKLQLKVLLADRPRYLALSALSAPTSPLRTLFESIRDETLLTRERPKPAAGGAQGDPKAAPRPLPQIFGAQGRAPGATIEAQFRAFHAAFEGGAGRTAIDDIVSTLNEITNNLILSATTPTQATRANQAMQEQVAKLRNSAARLPEPFARILRTAVGEFEKYVGDSTVGQIAGALKEQVMSVCPQIVTGKYPFTRGSTSEVPLDDFGRLFGAGGIMDQFFKQYLAQYADTSRAQWTWKQGTPMSTLLQVNALRSFQIAAWIRDAYMQGGNRPGFLLSIRPSAVAAGMSAKFETGGTAVPSPTLAAPTATPGTRPQPPGPAAPATVQWPGSLLRTSLTVAADNGTPSTIGRDGPWSLLRVLETGNLQVRAETATAAYLMGGQELHYQITTNSSKNPLDLATLRQFQCPTGI
jgi:type VI secretion system protein ImpL